MISYFKKATAEGGGEKGGHGDGGGDGGEEAKEVTTRGSWAGPK